MQTHLAAHRPSNLPSLVLVSDSQTSTTSASSNGMFNNNNHQSSNHTMKLKLETFLTQSQKLIPVVVANNQQSSSSSKGVYFKRISIFGGSQPHQVPLSVSSQIEQQQQPTSPAFPFVDINKMSDKNVRKTRNKVNEILKRKAIEEERARKLQMGNRRTKRIESIKDYQLLAEVVQAEKSGDANNSNSSSTSFSIIGENGEIIPDGGNTNSAEAYRLLRQQQLQKAKERDETKQQMLAFSNRGGLSKKIRFNRRLGGGGGAATTMKRTTYLLSSRGLTETEEERAKRIQERKNISAEEAFQMALQNVHRYERDRQGVNMQEKLMEEHLNNMNENKNNSTNNNTKQFGGANSLQAVNFRRREFERMQIEQDEKLFMDAKDNEGTSKLQDKALRQIRLKEDVFGIFRQFREETKEINRSNKNDDDPRRRQRDENENETSTTTMMKEPINDASSNSNNNNNFKKKSVLDMIFTGEDDDE